MVSRLFWRIVDVAALACAVVLLGLMRRLPDRGAELIAHVIVRFLLLVMPRARRVGMRNLEIVFPEKSVAERAQILKASFHVLARNLVTFAQLPDLTPEEAERRMPYQLGKDISAQLMQVKPGTGFIIASLHAGLFEQLVQIHTLLTEPCAIIARSFDLPLLDAYWHHRRERFGSKVFSRRGGYQQIVRQLGQGKAVAVLFDQNVKANHAMFVDFFGLPAATTKSVAYASIRTGAPIVFTTSVEPERGRNILIAEVVPSYEDLPTDERAVAIMEDLHRRTERVIREHPEQWFWIHRRWKTRPPGVPEDVYDGC